MKSELPVIETSQAERACIEDAVGAIEYPDVGYRAYLQQLREVKDGVLASYFAKFDPYRSLGRGGPLQPGLMKVVNLPVGENGLDLPPPDAAKMKKIDKPQYLSENVLTLFALHFGCPYSIFPEGPGLINNLVPSRSSSQDLSGAGANSDLDFHIENTAVRWLTAGDCAPKTMLMIGVKDDPSPPYTRVTDARLALTLLAPDDVVTLSQPLFRFRLPHRWRVYRARYEEMKTGWVPILAETRDGLLVNAAFYGDMLHDVASQAGREAVRRFRDALEEVAVDEVIRSGELLCIDNRVILHARTPFKATFDERGRACRWVQRLFVAEDLSPFSDWGRADDAVFVPSFNESEFETA